MLSTTGWNAAERFPDAARQFPSYKLKLSFANYWDQATFSTAYNGAIAVYPATHALHKSAAAVVPRLTH